MADDKVPDEIQREEDGMEFEIEGRLRWGTGMGAEGGRRAKVGGGDEKPLLAQYSTLMAPAR